MHSGMRITTNAMIRRYSTNLNRALGDLDSTRNTVSTNRNFNKVSEDPAAAMKSFKLRSNYARTEVQMENTKDALAKLDEVTSNVLNCNSMGRTFIADSLLSYSGPNRAYSSRQAYMQEIDQLVESFLQQMNGKYNENFIFGGASTKELPFTKSEETGEIFYRGVPVNTNSYLTREELSEAISTSLPFKDYKPALSDVSGAIMGAGNTSIYAGNIETAIQNVATNTTGSTNTDATKFLTSDQTNELINSLKENPDFQISRSQITELLRSNLTALNNDKYSADPTDQANASTPSLLEAVDAVMGGNSSIYCGDLEAALDKINGILSTDPANPSDINTQDIEDLKTALNDGSAQNIPTISKGAVEEVLKSSPLKLEDAAVSGTTPSLTQITDKIMTDNNGTVKDTINCDDLEKAIDALAADGTITDSQKYQLKANKEIGYQLKLATYFNEHSYRDIGFGMKEKQYEIVSTSAFDTAVNGLNIFGYGVEEYTFTDEDGNSYTYDLPNNIVALAQELSKTLAVDDISDFDQHKHDAIINKMKQCYDDMSDNGLAALGTKCKFLETTHEQLTEASQILNEQISDLDFCDPAEAITNLMWAQYAYNATLKVGNTLLSNSFIDFMS